LLSVPNIADFDYNCIVNFKDFASLASAWRSRDGDSNYNPYYDISDPNDGLIDELDLIVFVDNWLADCDN